MRRRAALHALLAIGVAARPAGAWGQAQRPRGPVRIGFATDFIAPGREVWRDLMRGRGWTYERDCVFVESGIPFGGDFDEAARRIVAERPDVIVVAMTAYAAAVHRLTRTIPVVMITSGYPVAAGLAQSLARPGKNITGNTAYASVGIWGKLLQLLKEVRPGMRRVGLLWDYLPPAHPREEIDFGLGELRDDARALGLEIHFGEVRRAADVAAGFAEFDARRVEGLLVTSGPAIFGERSRAIEAAIARRLPTITDGIWLPPVDPGPLLAYGPELAQLRRQAADYVDRILRGAKPGDLPIQQPAQFVFTANLRTAKALGITIPQSLLLRADRVIEWAQSDVGASPL